MKSQSGFWFALQPLYVAVASILGFGFIMYWLAGPFPLEDYADPNAFTSVVTYPIWVFEHAITFAFVTVLFLPLWKQFFDLVRETVAGTSIPFKWGIGVMLVMGVASVLAFFFLLLELSSTVTFSKFGAFPQGLSGRMDLLFFYPLAGVLPIPLCALLIYVRIMWLAQRIEEARGDSNKLFAITHDVLRYRGLLQNGLLIMGLVVSMVPIDSATLRAIFIALNPIYETAIPAMAVIAYGLGFTALLVVFYAPTHVALTQVSQKLRDTLYPIVTTADLERHIEARKNLEVWLQINLGIMDNLKAGIVTLAPLLTSFVTSILGIKL